MSRDIFHQTRLLRAPSNLASNTAREGASTASLSNLCQCFATLMVKNFFLLSNLNLLFLIYFLLRWVSDVVSWYCKTCSKIQKWGDLHDTEGARLDKGMSAGLASQAEYHKKKDSQFHSLRTLNTIQRGYHYLQHRSQTESHFLCKSLYVCMVTPYHNSFHS